MPNKILQLGVRNCVLYGDHKHKHLLLLNKDNNMATMWHLDSVQFMSDKIKTHNPSLKQYIQQEVE